MMPYGPCLPTISLPLVLPDGALCPKLRNLRQVEHFALGLNVPAEERSVAGDPQIP